MSNSYSAMEEEVKSSIKTILPQINDEELDWVYSQAYNTYLDKVFPLHYEIVEIPDNRPRAISWVKECAKEVIDRNGITATSYAENGVSWHWSTDMVSDYLLSRLPPPMVAVRGRKR